MEINQIPDSIDRIFYMCFYQPIPLSPLSKGTDIIDTQ